MLGRTWCISQEEQIYTFKPARTNLMQHGTIKLSGGVWSKCFALLRGWDPKYTGQQKKLATFKVGHMR